jgi:phage/plasmid primase-like uncharacterized protein
MITLVDASSDFCSAIRAGGLEAPEAVEPDGRLHRFSTNGKRAHDAGWYVLFGDGVPAGAFGCWRSGIRGTWRADIGRRLSPEEGMALRQLVARLVSERCGLLARSLGNEHLQMNWDRMDLVHPLGAEKSEQGGGRAAGTTGAP